MNASTLMQVNAIAKDQRGQMRPEFFAALVAQKKVRSQGAGSLGHRAWNVAKELDHKLGQPQSHQNLD